MKKTSSRSLTRRQQTARSTSVTTHVDAISTYNDRLSNILKDEKSKDALMREMEEVLFADKLKHAELIADVSFGHDLMSIEDECDKLYSECEEKHEMLGGQLREVIQNYEEAHARVTIAEVEGSLLQSQLNEVKTRENHYLQIIDNYKSKHESLLASEKNASSRATTLAKQSDEARLKHSKEYDKRPANQLDRKNGDDIVTLVKKAQDLRSAHATIMKNLHEIETKEIREFESEANARLFSQEEKLKKQFNSEEMKRIAKHDTHKQELEREQERLEEKIKADMEGQEKSQKNKIKKLTTQRSKLSVSIDMMRQQVVDYLAEKNVQNTQMKHLEAMSNERTKTLEKLLKEKKALEYELESTKAISEAASKNSKHVASKYRLVIKQNEKMATEIGKFSKLVTQGEEELDFSPPNKRIRSTKLK
mmetsp:Transcript_34079/g.43961  ORF Transcript_34079/g.43961 Transcript_34079/m.43961 type:complete len:421 (+) Transcript_34079:42-1304(+)